MRARTLLAWELMSAPRGGRLGRRVEKKKEQIAKVQLNSRSKEELKTVALGTSKINYLDPRITIAWCKANEVPLEKARTRRAFRFLGLGIRVRVLGASF